MVPSAWWCLLPVGGYQYPVHTTTCWYPVPRNSSIGSQNSSQGLGDTQKMVDRHTRWKMVAGLCTSHYTVTLYCYTLHSCYTESFQLLPLYYCLPVSIPPSFLVLTLGLRIAAVVGQALIEEPHQSEDSLFQTAESISGSAQCTIKGRAEGFMADSV